MIQGLKTTLYLQLCFTAPNKQDQICLCRGKKAKDVNVTQGHCRSGLKKLIILPYSRYKGERKNTWHITGSLWMVKIHSVPKLNTEQCWPKSVFTAWIIQIFQCLFASRIKMKNPRFQIIRERIQFHRNASEMSKWNLTLPSESKYFVICKLLSFHITAQELLEGMRVCSAHPFSQAVLENSANHSVHCHIHTLLGGWVPILTTGVRMPIWLKRFPLSSIKWANFLYHFLNNLGKISSTMSVIYSNQILKFTKSFKKLKFPCFSAAVRTPGLKL